MHSRARRVGCHLGKLCLYESRRRSQPEGDAIANRPSDQAVDAAVLPCDRAVGVLLAIRAVPLGSSDQVFSLSMSVFSLKAARKDKHILPKSAEVILHNAQRVRGRSTRRSVLVALREQRVHAHTKSNHRHRDHRDQKSSRDSFWPYLRWLEVPLLNSLQASIIPTAMWTSPDLFGLGRTRLAK